MKLYYNADRVDIFSNYERIASHSRDQRRFAYTTKEEHLASSHRYLSEWSPEKFIREAEAIDPILRQYNEGVLENKMHPEQAYKSCSGILQLHRKVGKERLIDACKRALNYQLFNYPILITILEKRLDRHQLIEDDADDQMPLHENIRGEDYYQ